MAFGKTAATAAQVAAASQPDPTAALYAATEEERKKREAEAGAAAGAPVATPTPPVDAVAAASQQTQMPATPPIVNPQSQVIESGTSGWQNQTTKQVQTADEKAAIETGKQLNEQAIDVEKDRGVLATDVALVNEQAAFDKAQIADEKAAAKQAALEVANQRIDAAASAMKAKQDAYAKMEPREFMGAGDTWRRVTSAIAVGLGGYAAGMLGQENSALKILDKAASDFRQRELDKIARGKNVADLARQDWADSQEGKISALKDVDIKYAAFFDKAAEAYAAELARKGVPLAKIEGDKNIVAIKQRGNDKLEETYKGLRESVTKGASGSINKRTATGDPSTFAGPGGGLAKNYLYDNKGEPVADLGDKTLAAKMREKASAYGDFQNALAALTDDIKKNKAVAPTVWGATLTDASANRQALRGTVLGSLKKAQELGALDNGVERLVNKTIGTEASGIINPTTVGLEQVQKLARAKFAGELRTSGIKADVARFEGAGGATPAGAPGAARSVVATGKDKQGRKMVKYSDGTIEVAP